MITLRRFLHSSVLFVIAAGSASAHPGHGPVDGFAAGLAHPLTGWDHILAMIAVGAWAARLRSPRLVPGAFLAAMVLGAGLGRAWGAFPGVDLGIVVSVVSLGWLALRRIELPLLTAAALAGVFALVHGWAHGSEMPKTAGGAMYGLGFIAATAALLAGGWTLGRLAGTRRIVRGEGNSLRSE